MPEIDESGMVNKYCSKSYTAHVSGSDDEGLCVEMKSSIITLSISETLVPFSRAISFNLLNVSFDEYVSILTLFSIFCPMHSPRVLNLCIARSNSSARLIVV